MAKKFIFLVLTLTLTAAVFAMNANATPLVFQGFADQDEFIDSRYPDTTSPLNASNGQYLWTGHQSPGNIHAYAFLQFAVGEDWKWQNAQLNIPFNFLSGNAGTTSVWFNFNDNWVNDTVTYRNLDNLWDWMNPVLLARKFVDGAPSENVTPFSFDISNLIDYEINETVSLVIGSILPNQIANGRYWRDIVNGDYINGTCAAKLVGTNQVAPVPEPATILLFGVGLLGLAGASRKKKVGQIT